MGTGSILITGASSGLGAEMARQFAALGYDLALCARRTERLDELAAEIAAAHPRVEVRVAALDVTDFDAVPKVFDRFAAELGRIDRVIVNAGLGKGVPFGKGGDRPNRQTVQTNFLGAMAQMEAAMKIFRAQGGGHLVVISSISAVRGMPKTMTAYAASKAGVAALAEGIAAERVPGVDVSIVYPGYIASEMNDKASHPPTFLVDTRTGVRSMVSAIEKRRFKAYCPAWPWVPLAYAMKVLPLSIVRRLAGI
ncbi:SDR family oxidoreductase [Nocardia sienata]|uniref:SDR family oxidoreductase n=1 Tax=Nocardia sienata TaxID=248552 RepID=UPI000A0121A1|nr:SDR family oxidoreductase [Nocardia sienata]